MSCAFTWHLCWPGDERSIRFSEEQVCAPAQYVSHRTKLVDKVDTGGSRDAGVAPDTTLHSLADELPRTPCPRSSQNSPSTHSDE